MPKTRKVAAVVRNRNWNFLHLLCHAWEKFSSLMVWFKFWLHSFTVLVSIALCWMVTLCLYYQLHACLQEQVCWLSFVLCSVFVPLLDTVWCLCLFLTWTCCHVYDQLALFVVTRPFCGPCCAFICPFVCPRLLTRKQSFPWLELLMCQFQIMKVKPRC